MTRVYVARHSGDADAPGGEAAFDEAATGAAQQLAAALADESLDAVYTAPFEQAERTAEIIAIEHAIEAEPLAALSGTQDADREEAAGRVRPAVDMIREDHPEGTVALVGHTRDTRSMVMAALGADPGHGHRIRQDNACLNVLEHEDYRGWRVHRVNDTAHLADH